MQTSEFAVRDRRNLIKHFEYWSAYLMKSGFFVALLPKREITKDGNLRSAERAELYAVVIPEAERLMEEAMRDLGIGKIDVIQKWCGTEMWLWTPAIKPEMRVGDVFDAYQRAIHAAA